MVRMFPLEGEHSISCCYIDLGFIDNRDRRITESKLQGPKNTETNHSSTLVTHPKREREKDA